MIFNETIVRKLKVVDEALSLLGEVAVVENSLFKPTDLNASFYADFEIQKTGSIRFRLRISQNTIEIDLAGRPEVFVWDDKRINDDRDEIVTTLCQVLSSYFVVDCWGELFQRFAQYDAEGMPIKTTATIRLFHSFFPHHKDKYDPIFPIA